MKRKHWSRNYFHFFPILSKCPSICPQSKHTDDCSNLNQMDFFFNLILNQSSFSKEIAQQFDNEKKNLCGKWSMLESKNCIVQWLDFWKRDEQKVTILFFDFPPQQNLFKSRTHLVWFGCVEWCALFHSYVSPSFHRIAELQIITQFHRFSIYGSMCVCVSLSFVIPFSLSIFIWSVVVNQFYDAEIIKEYIIKGNAAVLKCSIPSFVADFVYVESWIDEEGTVYEHSDSYGVFVV